VLGGIPGAAIVAAWKYFRPPDSWPEIFAVVAVTGATTVVFAWFVSLEQAERQRLLMVFRRGRPKPAAGNGNPSLIQ